jgi:hypothetical protein
MSSVDCARVSAVDRNPQLQLDVLREDGLSRISIDHGVSGSTARCPEL